MAPALGLPRIVLRVLCPFCVLWTGFSQDSFPVSSLPSPHPTPPALALALFLCVLYYIVKGILAKMLGFGTRGEQEYRAVYFQVENPSSILRPLDSFLFDSSV